MEHPVPGQRQGGTWNIQYRVRGRGVHGTSSTGSEVGGYMEHPVPGQR